MCQRTIKSRLGGCMSRPAGNGRKYCENEPDPGADTVRQRDPSGQDHGSDGRWCTAGTGGSYGAIQRRSGGRQRDF